jgi:predicted acetyltransferase
MIRLAEPPRLVWPVPSTVFWYVSGEYYLVAPWRRQGHATRMLAAGLDQCRGLGLDRVLLTCDAGNEPSRRVILANGGVPDGHRGGEDHFWIDLGRA